MHGSSCVRSEKEVEEELAKSVLYDSFRSMYAFQTRLASGSREVLYISEMSFLTRGCLARGEVDGL